MKVVLQWSLIIGRPGLTVYFPVSVNLCIGGYAAGRRTRSGCRHSLVSSRTPMLRLSTTVSTPYLPRIFLLPIPDHSRMAGDPVEPAAGTISFCATAWSEHVGLSEPKTTKELDPVNKSSHDNLQIRSCCERKIVCLLPHSSWYGHQA